MPDTIDVRGLSDEEILLLEEIVKHFRLRARQPDDDEEIRFAAWPLGVKGKLSRQEIYDHL